MGKNQYVFEILSTDLSFQSRCFENLTGVPPRVVLRVLQHWKEQCKANQYVALLSFNRTAAYTFGEETKDIQRWSVAMLWQTTSAKNYITFD